MEMIVISKEELNTMLSENIERTLSSLLEKYNFVPRNVKNKTKKEAIDLDEEISNWIPMQEAWRVMNIKKNMWYSKFQFIIQHKPYGKLVWVYKPSIYDFFIKDNINKKAN